MSLIARLGRNVSPQVRLRGASYFQNGVVTRISRSRSGDRVQATVIGSRLYEVELELEPHAVLASCTCPYVESEFDICKHIWATVLAAADKDALRELSSSGRVSLQLSSWTDDSAGSSELLDDEEPWPEAVHEPAAPKHHPWRADGKTAKRVLEWRRRVRQTQSRVKRKAPKPPPEWERLLSSVGGALSQTPRAAAWPAEREIFYTIDVPSTLAGKGLTIEITFCDRTASGERTRHQALKLSPGQMATLPQADQRVLPALAGLDAAPASTFARSHYGALPSVYHVGGSMPDVVMRDLCLTGRCRLRCVPLEEAPAALQWDEGDAWEFCLGVTEDASTRGYTLAGSICRQGQRLHLSDPVMLTAGGLVFFDDHVARLRDFDAFPWIALLRKQPSVHVPANDSERLLEKLFAPGPLPKLELPESIQVKQIRTAPRPCLKVLHPQYGARLPCTLSFDYDGALAAASQSGATLYRSAQRQLVWRDLEAEQRAVQRIEALGLRRLYDKWTLARGRLPRAISELVAAGWAVEAEGKLFRGAGSPSLELRSGIDWFELHGSLEFGEARATLPALLAALKRRENTVVLDDGTVGLIPEEWLRSCGSILQAGAPEADHLRFERRQLVLLDGLVAERNVERCDEVFERARQQLAGFEGILPLDAPAGFTGQLRPYQREALGWFDFLTRFGFGGCLADDMGLGKTVQVLALLQSRAAAIRNGDRSRPAAPHKPSLVVVPRSLIFNWKAEAARFTPRLRVLDHTGLGRSQSAEKFSASDLVLTTYGTLRRDLALLKDIAFNYVILDEAQAIKNSGSQSARAVRMLQADHRLALSGTPIENHLGELGSLFEFLNPGLLSGRSLSPEALRRSTEHERAFLSRALRPLILRRTKSQVEKDLPAKVEQTLYCELETDQRRLYDELRQHYRDALLRRVGRDGLAKSKMHVLEALLRLRQAACHPGLLDRAKAGQPSAKTDLLFLRLEDVLQEGHKALVFSQFTSLLALVQNQLRSRGIPYEYLDGKTRDRQRRVEHFQSDPDCRLFLISLKAGGVGLNLTAAEYVFLLDPWWNPAVEVQAIDRTHRIGQTRPVFAYRLIARDTVEEKVLELQQTKRDLADAILNADGSLIGNLQREDLELLLS